VHVLLPYEATLNGMGLIDDLINRSMRFGREVMFHPEYLDLTRFPDPAHQESVVRYLRSLHETQKADLVMAVGFQGLDFALKYGGEIFGDIPVVFVGVERSRLEVLKLPSGFTGVTHFDDVQGTLEAALQLQPDTTEVAVVVGSSESDQYWFRHDRLIFDRFAARVHFRYLTDLPMLDLLREVSRLKPHTVIFLHALYSLAGGQDFSDKELLDLIRRNANAPLYGMAPTEGFVGGRPMAEDDQRFPMALDIVRRIVAGENASNIPIQQAKPKYSYIFDAKELRRWNIDFSRLPHGSHLVNVDPSFWQQHLKLAFGVISLITLESLLLAILLAQRARRKKAEALLADRNDRLQASEHSLRELSGQLIGAQEEERKRIARELHDDLTQQVADLGIRLSNIKRTVPVSMESTRGELANLQSRLLSLADGLRHISHELHPGMLEIFGLVTALRSHCAEFSTVTSLPVEFETNCDEAVPPDTALCLYRITQEALRNAAKHAHAAKVRVSLTKSENLLHLSVADDGVGFDIQKAQTNSSLGLRSMEERVWLVHGKIALTSQPGRGTTLTATVEWTSSRNVSAAMHATQKGN